MKSSKYIRRLKSGFKVGSHLEIEEVRRDKNENYAQNNVALSEW